MASGCGGRTSPDIGGTCTPTGSSCRAADAFGVCSPEAECRPVTCPPHLGDCDGDTFNGCEARLDASPHCGSCGHSCAVGYACVAARCENDAIDVAIGDLHTCVLLAGGEVWCWGENTSGQLGDGTFDHRDRPVLVSAIRARDVAANFARTCAALQDGGVACWGSDGLWKATRGSPLPVRVPALFDAVAVSTGGVHACAVTGAGRVLCWGNNADGQLGREEGWHDERAVLQPQLAELENIALTVVAPRQSTCVLDRDGTIWRWGTAAGLDSRADHHPWVEPLPIRARSVDCGDFHGCAQDDTDSTWCWGLDHLGSLGRGEVDDGVQPPAPIPAAPAAERVTVSEGRTCIWGGSPRVSCWGGSAGTRGGAAPEPTVYEFPGLVRSMEIEVVDACVTLEDGSAWCWPRGEFEGDAAEPRGQPIRVDGLPSP